MSNLQSLDYTPITLALLFVFAAAGGWAVITRRRHALVHQFIIGLSLGGFNIYQFSTVWSPTKVTTIFILLSLFTARWHVRRTDRSTSELLIMLAGGLLISTMLAFLFYLPINEAAGLQSATVRPLVQAYSYLSILSLAPFTMLALDTSAKVRRALSVVMYSALASAAIAILQFVILLTGGSFMPILRMTGRHNAVAAFGFGGHVLTRLYAFAGEPKSLAVIMLPALIIAFVTYGGRSGRKVPKWASAGSICALAFVLTCTFSTAAFLAVGLIAVPLVLTLGRFYPTTMLRAAISVVVAILVLVGGYGYSQASATDASPQGPALSDLVYARSAGRLEGEWRERHEYDAIAYLLEKPRAWVFGLGPGMYNFHLPGLISGSIIEPLDAGWLVVMLDLGLFGTVLFLTWIARVVASVWRRATAAKARREHDLLWCLLATTSAMIGVAMLFVGVSSPTLLGSVFLFGGMAEATLALAPLPKSRAMTNA